jgi:hypothetical protein
MNLTLLKPSEVDLLFRYPAGWSLKLAKAGRIPHIVLPDGEIRFVEAEILKLLRPASDQRDGKLTVLTEKAVDHA